MMGFLLFTAPSLSPRLDVNTFKQTLRGGISFSLFARRIPLVPVELGGMGRKSQEKKGPRVFQAKSVAAESFAEKRCEV